MDVIMIFLRAKVVYDKFVPFPLSSLFSVGKHFLSCLKLRYQLVLSLPPITRMLPKYITYYLSIIYWFSQKTYYLSTISWFSHKTLFTQLHILKLSYKILTLSGVKSEYYEKWDFYISCLRPQRRYCWFIWLSHWCAPYLSSGFNSQSLKTLICYMYSSIDKIKK